ncbi:MAG: ImmA/IrrE family metallo-endopeptidase [Jatrophihabitantaceae bacterium]
MHNTTTTQGAISVLASLRALAPNHPITLEDALRLAERQANRLLALFGGATVPVPTSIITDQPRITVEHDPALPTNAASGCSDWDIRRHTWVISLNPTEPRRRRRFTVLHEYKHILDHYHPGLTGPLPRTVYGLSPVEYVAEYFAGCVLIPKRLLAAAYYDGIQRPADLAQLFDVSKRAIEVRLTQIGLSEANRPVGGQTSPFGMRTGRPRYFRTATRPVELAV